jgi:short-subunit dehydrogenase
LGATSTIARALAAEFAAHGYELILAGRDREELEPEAFDLALRHRTKAETRLFDVLNFENLQESLLGVPF